MPRHFTKVESFLPPIQPRQFAALFDAVPAALMVFDSDLVMLHANPPYLEAVGMRLDQVAGHRIFDVFPDDPDRDGPSQADDLRSVLERTIATGEPQVLHDYRYDIPTADGGFDQRIWNVIETPVRAADGSVEMVVHYTEDVTDITRARAAADAAHRVADELRIEVDDVQDQLRQRARELEELNAELLARSARDRSIAETLQRALLPDLPDTDLLDLQVGYQPAVAQVGGDWYDAVMVTPSTMAVMIGDVIGHDIEAAAAMGQLRNMWRALAWGDATSPARTLGQLDRAIRDLGIDTFATAVMATFTAGPDGLVVTWANAGHPPPLLVHATDGVEPLVPRSIDPLLGFDPDATRIDHRVVLAAGDQLLLYTDGLVETRGASIDVGLDRLVEVVSRHRDVDRIIDEMVGADHDDDIAVLLVQAPGPAVPAAGRRIAS